MLQALDKISRDIAVIVVANVKGITTTEDYEEYSVITDFFSERELDEIVRGYREYGFYVEVFTDEEDFIKDVVQRKLDNVPRKLKLIYNTSQKGIGPSRHCLAPAFCKLYRLSYTGSNGYVSSLCRHKYHFNSLLSRHLPSIPNSWLYDNKSDQWLLGKKPPFGVTVIQKPIYEAASVGITADSVYKFDAGSEERVRYSASTLKQPIIVEEFIKGYEIEVPVIIEGEDCYGLGPVGISLENRKFLADQILGYQDVYDDLYSFYEFKELDEDKNTRILSHVEDCSRILGIEDFGRMDFRVRDDGKYFLTDITTNPHITKHSSCNFIFNKLGFSHSELLGTIIAVAARRYGWI